MRLLVLGGTVFLGRHVVDAALAAGHDVTLFHRGKSGAELYPECERLLGDRNGDLSALAHGRWDAVVDTSGYLPRQVAATAALLADRVEHYTFISSGSVYADPAPGTAEDGVLAELGDMPDDKVDGGNYGPLKAICEQVAEACFPGRALNVRPGLIVGPWDNSERFTYWPRRLERGGEVLAPAPRERPVQIIDVRDLAEWLVRCAADRLTGVFNACGPAAPTTMEQLLDACRAGVGGDAHITWVDEAFLIEQGVAPWMELPLWIPRGDDGLLQTDGSRAIAAGLTFRPVADTAADTLAWDAQRDRERGVASHTLSGKSVRVGLDADRERQLLLSWAGRA